MSIHSVTCKPFAFPAAAKADIIFECQKDFCSSMVISGTGARSVLQLFEREEFIEPGSVERLEGKIEDARGTPGFWVPDDAGTFLQFYYALGRRHAGVIPQNHSSVHNCQVILRRSIQPA
ncbi:hypothetical protein M413DRAFT_198934 [Hebeloma cylindrosporum]|uniref:Uncharacterized protein n=1 Tax=Hebeloma cylindrosporum TaxID=76867 RepID=A0A0C2XP09_HEBCY|nr:hypothetical protein M413DRAFT_198934 [Hebeloma cylindrosporum h7]